MLFEDIMVYLDHGDSRAAGPKGKKRGNWSSRKPWTKRTRSSHIVCGVGINNIVYVLEII